MYTNKAFILRDICGKFILVPFRANEASDDPILFNEIAATIWEYASKYKDRDELLNKITQLYGIEQNSTEMFAVDNFITQMVKIKLLKEEVEEI